MLDGVAVWEPVSNPLVSRRASPERSTPRKTELSFSGPLETVLLVLSAFSCSPGEAGRVARCPRPAIPWCPGFPCGGLVLGGCLPGASKTVPEAGVHEGAL